ncbi:HD domain-containing phosphohydrolase [Edaphobacter bradus]|uniref:HD domain-containing phosphohydrolase n=1 Tax=Edaphobacter bradus TaxID=2259016 RepID=UPI0021E0F1C6|nr:HD domain-containing phosphohydrolase [Edaphobacter bradus]
MRLWFPISTVVYAGTGTINYMVQTSASFRRGLSNTDGSISLSEIISALSYALDLTEGAVLGHALRSCLLGMRIAAELKLTAEATSSLYFALLLKDVGRSSNANTSTTHEIVLQCDRGAGIVTKLGLGAAAAEAVRSIEEHWDGGGHPDALKGGEIPLLSRICAVAQHLDVFSGECGVEKAIHTLIERSGTWFDPELVRVAVSLHRRGVLWNHCLPSDSQDDTRRAVLDLDAGTRHTLEGGRIDQICEAFADVVDAKSHFTFRHSMGVADAAYGIAREMGLAPERVQLVRRAALLHDIGKLSVPNTILDKATYLDEFEWESVYQHPGLTRQILERIGPFREMAIIAGEHHEKLDGTGYPNRLMRADLSLESRIVAVADVYGALSEDRPYRTGLDLRQIVSILTKLAPRKLDPDCVDALLRIIAEEPAAGLIPIPVGNVPQLCA